MEWHWTELSELLHHLPHSVKDMLHHEDKALVKAGLSGFVEKEPEEGQRHKLILPDDSVKEAGGEGVAIEKDIDPSASRSKQNLDLLLQDYLHTLPHYEAGTQDAQKLLEHWRKVLLEQPQRIAQAKQSYWHSEEAKKYWQDHVRHIKPDHVIYDETWEHLSGDAAINAETLAARKEKYWRDLIIRHRLHRHTIAGESEGYGIFIP